MTSPNERYLIELGHKNGSLDSFISEAIKKIEETQSYVIDERVQKKHKFADIITQKELLTNATSNIILELKNRCTKLVNDINARISANIFSIKLIADNSTDNPSKPSFDFILKKDKLTLSIEKAGEGHIFLSFGNPAKQKHVRFNWVLRATINEEKKISWYFFNAKEQISPKFRIKNIDEVIKFLFLEMIQNANMYLT